MESSKFLDYTKIFKELYEEKKIKVKWGNASAGLRSFVNIEEELRIYGDDYTEEEFIQAAFRIVQISKQISVGMDRETEINDEYKIVSEVFLGDNDELKEHILVQSSSNSNVFDDITYEILTKREKTNPKNVIAYTALLNMFVRDASSSADEAVLDKITLELTTGDIGNMIATLQKIIDDVNTLK